MQILIADDDPVSRRLATHALAGCGAEVAVVEDGHAAWKQIQERTQSTVLILDRMMPGVDGVELCRGARLLPAFPPLYILMVTSAAETSDITAGLEAGADDYVVKPFSARELVARVEAVLRRTSQPRSAEPAPPAPLDQYAEQDGGQAHHQKGREDDVGEYPQVRVLAAAQQLCEKQERNADQARDHDGRADQADEIAI
jgi:DNA-binding response OmpR family regulator